MGRTGAYVYHSYQDESTFLTQPGSLTRVVGLEPNFTNIEIKENLLKLVALNQNTVAQYAWGKFEGSGSADFTWSNAWPLSWVFGAPVTTGAGPFTHTYGPTMPKPVTSFSLEVGFTGESANVQRDFNGCVVNTLSISSRINEVVKGNLSFMIAKEVDGTTINGSPPADSIVYPFTFVQAKVQLPNGTTLTEVQDFEIIFNPNHTYIYGMNSQYPVGVVRGLTEITGKFTLSEKDNTWLANTTGRAQLATVTIILDNGLAGTNQKTLTLEFNNVGLDTFAVGYVPNQIVNDSVPFTAQNVNTMTMIDNVSALP